MRGSNDDAKRRESNTDARAVTSKKKSTSALDVFMLVLIVLAVGFGISSVLGGEPEAQASSGSAFLPAVIGENSPASPPGATDSHIVLEDGVLYLRGIAESADDVDDAVAMLEPIFGEGNVVAEVTIDADYVDLAGGSTSVYFAENVLFQSGSAEIASQFEDVLASSASFLQISEETTIEISGHTDSNGTEESNLTLSQARVDAARRAMIAAGGDADRITAIGLGESEPIATNETAEGRQQNRRVELTLNTLG